MKLHLCVLLFGAVCFSYPVFAQDQEYVLPAFCSDENMEPVRSKIKYSSKWNDRLAAARAARSDQGTLDEAAPESFDRRAETSPPIVTIPRTALRRNGSRGACEILVDIHPDGTPTDLIVACTHRRYRGNAGHAVKQARFAPAFQNGQPVTKFGAIIPMDFCVQPFED